MKIVKARLGHCEWPNFFLGKQDPIPEKSRLLGITFPISRYKKGKQIF